MGLLDKAIPTETAVRSADRFIGSPPQDDANRITKGGRIEFGSPGLRDSGNGKAQAERSHLRVDPLGERRVFGVA